MAETEPTEPQEGTDTENAGVDPPADGDQPSGEPAASEVDQATEKHLTDLRKENASWRTKLRKAETEIEKLRSSSASDLDKAKAEARQEAIAEATTEANKRIVRAEVLAAAAGKLRDPSDAFGQLDLDGIELDDNGEVDRGALAGLVDDLVKAKPYLGVTRDPDFGARSSAVPANSDAAMDSWLRQTARR